LTAYAALHAIRLLRRLPVWYWSVIHGALHSFPTRRSSDLAKLIAYVKSAEFDVAGFKGRKLNYRSWNGQLRQPILVSTAKLPVRSEEHTSELQSRENLVCRLLLEKKKQIAGEGGAAGPTRS